MKIDFLADINFLVYVHEGKSIVEPFIAYEFAVSFISEVELLGYTGISASDERLLQKLLSDCYIIEWGQDIKKQTITLRRKYNIKLPDAIVAASALVYELPLVTADRGFSKVSELDLVLIEVP
jgi:predicted nucleic acid-binding protein